MTFVQCQEDVKLLNKILEKVVLVSSEKLSTKSYEYLRLLKVKQGTGLMKMSDSCAAVVCINLAADNLSCSFDKALAIKMAGVSKRNYMNLYHSVSKVLGLDRPLTVSELCLRLACPDVSQLAQRLIDRYVRDRDEGLVRGASVDLDHPMYACAAVLAATRHRKVKVKKEGLVELCRVKVKDLDKLAGELAALAEQTDKQPSRKRGHHLLDMVEQMVKESEKTSVNTTQEEEEDDQPQESFAEWKKRILSKAGDT